MCKKHTEKRIDSIDNENDEVDDNEEDNKVEDNDSGMTKEEVHRKVREHMDRRKEAYVKMGTVDNPR
jgi:hypothetical protein